jgi:hypothetical protein
LRATFLEVSAMEVARQHVGKRVRNVFLFDDDVLDLRQAIRVAFKLPTLGFGDQLRCADSVAAV